MDIASGLAGLKAAADLTKILREGAKSGSMKPDEFAGRIGEIYDYIIDSRAALVDAQEESQQLKQQIRELQNNAELATDLAFDGSVYWRKSEGAEAKSPYCSICWDSAGKLVRCQNYGTDKYDDGSTQTRYHCGVHNKVFHSKTVRYK